MLKRPLAAIGLTYFAVLVVACFLDSTWSLAIALLLISVLLIAITIPKFRKAKSVIVLMSVAIFAFFYYGAYNLLCYENVMLPDGSVITIEGIVEDDVRQVGELQSFSIKVTHSDDIQITRPFYINMSYVSPGQIEPYDFIKARVALKNPMPSYGFDAVAQAKSEGDYYYASFIVTLFSII